jgi:hypothetical protein
VFANVEDKGPELPLGPDRDLQYTTLRGGCIGPPFKARTPAPSSAMHCCADRDRPGPLGGSGREAGRTTGRLLAPADDVRQKIYYGNALRGLPQAGWSWPAMLWPC